MMEGTAMGMRQKLLDVRWWLGIRPRCVSLGDPKLSVAVVVPAFNEERTIEKTVKSIKEQTMHIDEIYVVDDCSTDRTGEIAQNMGVTVMRTPKNQGTKSRALNHALVHIDCDLVVTIDADTLLASDAIEKTMPYFNDVNTFSVCSMVVPQRVKTLWERGRLIEYLYGVTIIKAGQNNCGVVMVSSGCFTVFRNQYLKKLGFFKERSIAEDMDLTWEAHFVGYKIFCEITSLCYPLDPPTLSIYYKQLRRWYSGFLQCIAIHKWGLCCHWQFGILYFYYLFESIFFPIIIVALLIYNAALWKVSLVLLVIHEIFVILPALYRGWRVRMFWKSLLSIPAYYMTRPVNLAALYASVFQEWILSKKLAIWHKGH